VTAAHPSRHAAHFIEVEGLTKSYVARSGIADALAEVSFTVAEGEFVSLIGPSGCGKSTLLMCIGGLMEPSSGYVLIGGQRVVEPWHDLGLVFQDDLLMEWRDALQNVLVQAEFRRIPKRHFESRARELLMMVGLGERMRSRPSELSGGMRQRVAICRALVHDPPLLLMDEPFGALDALTRDQLNLELEEIWRATQKTVLFVTHSIPEAVFLSDRVLVMSASPGTVIADVRVEIERPRTMSVRETPSFGALVREVRACLRPSLPEHTVHR
jgi:NitT/TauT family transport system ATP-binding protein